MKRMGFKAVISIFFLSMLVDLGSVAQAAQVSSKKAAFQATKFGLLQQNYTGATNKSFAEGSPGYGVEISTDSGGTYLRYFLKGRINYAQGRQNFLNGNTTFTTNYKYSAFAPELGISLYPVSRRDSGANMYLWGVGSFSYSYLDVASVPSGSTLKTKDQGFGTGYGGGLGFEFIFSSARGSTSRKLIYGEVGFRDERVDIFQVTQFEISGLTFSLGFGF